MLWQSVTESEWHAAMSRDLFDASSKSRSIYANWNAGHAGKGLVLAIQTTEYYYLPVIDSLPNIGTLGYI